MKKIFSLFVAALAAMTLSAGELTVDLSQAKGYTHAEDGSGEVQLSDGVLTVNWMVGTGWEVAGTEIPVDELEGVSKVKFDYVGDGGEVTMYLYLRDSEGNRWWNEDGYGLNTEDWTSDIEFVPSAPLWDAPAYAYGERPIVSMGFIANPATPTSGTFKLRNIKVTCECEEPAETKPSVAPIAPDKDEDYVMGIYCSKYTVNNANFGISGWAQGYETLDLDGTKAAYWAGFTWECVIDPAHTDDPHDFSAYKSLHFDMWVPAAAKIQLAAEAVAGGNYKDGPVVDLVPGWNYFDIELAGWPGNYDFKNMKCFTLQQFQTPEGASFEGNPFAIANIYLWTDELQSVSNIQADKRAVKRIVNGQIMIEKNGVLYNVLGTQF